VDLNHAPRTAQVIVAVAVAVAVAYMDDRKDLIVVIGVADDMKEELR
jgi:hypothetical protein